MSHLTLPEEVPISGPPLILPTQKSIDVVTFSKIQISKFQKPEILNKKITISKSSKFQF